ncbi:MAG: outer membrane protein assembly factor BamA [Candidatus Competibacteraceae bacterium]|nr:outer membrane protein assembly factor BamA [Candidatus Competibacteraceae bacterium]
MRKPFSHLLAFLCLLAPLSAPAFVVEDIQVEGLERISAGTVFNYLPVTVGDFVEEQDYPEIIRALFATGLFTDVALRREGDVLVVEVAERPAIAEIEITGNQDISTEDLMTALEEVGLVEGRVFDRALLDKLEQELIRQYYARGKYAVEVDTRVQPLERNRVAIILDIAEGKAARIRQINIVGNQAFSDQQLLDEFQLSTTGWLSFFSRDDQYSRQALAADIETLRSYYLDRGYLNFNVNSTQVSITPDKQDIYITLNITEGDRYTVSNIDLSGELILPEAELRELVSIEPGEIFSRFQITESVERIADRLGDLGYAFANINPVPQVDPDSNQVALNLLVDPGRRVYVRRINFTGNIRTHDEVLRREMRQMEGAWFSTEDIERSRVRLQRLSYLETVDVETPAVAGTNDQVDVNVTVTERPAGRLIFGVGYGQESGVLLNASVNQRNFLGTGNEVGFTFNNSRTNTIYSFSYNNPYYTLDGISRGFRLYYREIDAEEANVADYVIDAYGAEISFGIPLNEFDTLNFAAGYEHLTIDTASRVAREIRDFLDDNGEEYDNFKLQTSWSTDSRNRAFFPNRGMLNRVSAELTLPGSDAEYYKIGARHLSYLPAADFLTLSLRGELGYGDGYGTIEDLPFFENYFAGGLRSVRGFEANTLGPRFDNDEPSGGSFKITGGADAIFPLPFERFEESARIAAFVDAGNVFASAGDFDAGEIRYSAGLSLLWLTPVGPLALSVAQPLNDQEDDETESFQFSFGVPF